MRNEKMKLSKRLILGGLFIIFTFFFSSCNLIENLVPSAKPQSDSKKEEINQRLREAANKLNQAEQDFNNQNSQAKSERSKCTTMTAQSQKSGRDPNNPESDTFKQCKIAKDLEDKAEISKGKLDDANKEKDKIAEELKALNSAPNGNQEGISTLELILWLLAGILGIGLLVLALWLIYRFIKNIKSTIIQEHDDNSRNFRRIEGKQSDQARELSELKATVRLLSDKIDKQKNYLADINNRISEPVKHSVQTQQYLEPEPPVYKPEPQFPVSVENYLNKFRHQGQKATADFIGGLLIQDSNRGEEFLIVRDSSLADGLFYAVPSIDRFSKGTDFTTYYQNYYDCENPSGGTVRILAPSIVSRVDGGWKLEEKGRLEIRN
jgi:hypothetical protein